MRRVQTAVDQVLLVSTVAREGGNGRDGELGESAVSGTLHLSLH